ncbi:MAG: MOSC domain-containing protein [Actinomycetes bacterium]
MGRLLAVCRVARLHPDDSRVGVTAIDKQAVSGQVLVRDLGLRGDVQADREDHGGPDQALYAYADEEASFWARELGRDVPYGWFGENLRTADVDVDGAVLGEHWQVGGSVLLEVTGPRIPCATFARWVHEPRWVRRFAEHGRPGAYLRVLRKGVVSAGDEISVTHRPSHGVTLERWFTRNDPADANALVEYVRESGWVLPENLRLPVLLALRRAALG